MVQLDIGGQTNGASAQSIDVAPEELNLDPADFEQIHVDAELDTKGDRILVSLVVSGVAHLICDRTSEPFEQRIEGTHTLLFVPADRVESLESDTDDVRGYEPADLYLDVTESVYDTLLLSVPIRKIAPGAEEAEIPTSFGGSDENIDPRWEALKKLKKQ